MPTIGIPHSDPFFESDGPDGPVRSHEELSGLDTRTVGLHEFLREQLHSQRARENPEGWEQIGSNTFIRLREDGRWILQARGHGKAFSGPNKLELIQFAQEHGLIERNS